MPPPPAASSAPPSKDLPTFILAHPSFPKSRLVSLYSDFRPQLSTNPDGFHANTAAWTAALSDAAAAGLLSPTEALTLTAGPALEASLAAEGCGRPLAIGAALGTALSTRALIPLSTFLTQTTPIHHTSLLTTLSGTLWRLLIGGSTAPPPNPPPGQYVIPRNVELTSQHLLTHLHHLLENSTNPVLTSLWTHDDFHAEFLNPLLPTHPKFSPTDLAIILKYLSRDVNAITLSPTTIKFHLPTTSTTTTQPQAITETDTLLANLKHSISTLTLSLHNLAETSSSLHALILATLPKSKASALHHLRSQKLVEKQIAHRTSSLEQLTALLTSLTQAQDNVTTLRLLESGGKALAELTAQTGGVENVEAVLERVREAGEGVEEVSRAINRLGEEKMEEVVDEEEVERELAEMEEAERAGERQRENKRAEERARRDAEELARSLECLEVVDFVGDNERERERERVHAS
ncbi:hypothetical protein DFH27DRAFT_575928 [Peziza echinospora]|nr:hypothetical protein DFH27DRAFT_575928 [Peziza echinospora]